MQGEDVKTHHIQMLGCDKNTYNFYKCKGGGLWCHGASSKPDPQSRALNDDTGNESDIVQNQAE